jgi:hypothetical protein
MTLMGLGMTMANDVNDKGSGEITLRKSTVLIVGLVPAFVLLLFNVGTPIATFIRDDQSKTVQLQMLQKTLEDAVAIQKVQTADIQFIKQSLAEIQRTAKK